MSRQTGRPPRRPLALEPLEDRLLLSILVGPLPGANGGVNPHTPAAVTQNSSSAAAPDADTPPGGYPTGQADTTPAVSSAGTTGPSPSVSPDGQGQAGSPYANGSANAQTAYAAPSGQAGEAAAEYYLPTARTAASPATTATTAVLGVTAAGAVSVPPVRVAPSQPPAVLAPPPVQPAALSPAAVAAGPGEVPVPSAVEDAWDGFRQGLSAAAVRPTAEENPGPASFELDTGRLFPLALPLPGGLLPLELAAWESGVRDLFRRLDALDDGQAEGPAWERLASWCAAVGVVTVALEVSRRQLGKRSAPGLTDTAGRGLAWQWFPVPRGEEPPESS